MESADRQAGGGREVEVTPVADRALFEAIAAQLQVGLDGRWIRRLDGLDECYWDLRRGEAMITLHLQQYLGIRLLVDPDGGAADQALLHAAIQLLSRRA